MNTDSLDPSGWLTRVCRSVAAVLLIVLGVAPHRLSAQNSPANVVVISIDTLRADHLGCYGYGSVATPNLDALARSAARFTQAFTPVPHHPAGPHGAFYGQLSHGDGRA